MLGHLGRQDPSQQKSDHHPGDENQHFAREHAAAVSLDVILEVVDGGEQRAGAQFSDSCGRMGDPTSLSTSRVADS